MTVISTPLRYSEVLELNQSSLQAAGLLSWFPIGHYRDGRNLATYKLPRRAAAEVNVGGVVTHGHRRGVQFPGSGTNSHYVFLDGAGMYYGPIRGTNEFSLFMWINAAAIGSVLTAFSQGGGWIQLRVEADGKLGCSVDGSSVFESSATLSALTWYHVGVTSVGTAQKLYINGIQDGSASQTPAVSSAGHINTGRIGAHNSGQYPWNGLLDDLRIHKRTLSDAEVLTVYNETRDGGYGDLAAKTQRFYNIPFTAAEEDTSEPTVIVNKQADLVEGPSNSFDVVTEIRDERRGATGRGVSWQPGPAQVVTYGTRSDPSTQAVLDRLDNRFVTTAARRIG